MIFTLNFFHDFRTAIYYAKQKNFQEIFDLLSKTSTLPSSQQVSIKLEENKQLEKTEQVTPNDISNINSEQVSPNDTSSNNDQGMKDQISSLETNTEKITPNDTSSNNDQGMKDQISSLETNTEKITPNDTSKINVQEMKDQIIRLETENSNLKAEIIKLKDSASSVKNDTATSCEDAERLRAFLFALKEKIGSVEFFDLSEYKEESVIGEGATSSVKIVSHVEKYAKKELKEFNEKNMQRFIGEGEILFSLRHPCIVYIVGFNYGDSVHPPSLILRLEPTSLEASIANGELDNNQKNRAAVEVVLAMRYVHKRGLMHRDLKPSNILLSKKRHVRVSDFGLAREEDIESSQSKGVGTLRFMAPELFIEDEDETKERTKYNNKIDVYSFGIVLIYIVTGSYPKFNMRNVVNGVPPKLQDTIVGWMRDLILRCLSLEPESRPSFAEIFDVMKDNNYDMFSESKGKKLTSKQQRMKDQIEARVLKIEAFEYQHQNDK